MNMPTYSGYSDDISPGNNSSRTQQADRDKNVPDSNQGFAINIPKIELPKGGGALKNIDEKFQVNAANGTASFSVPLPFSKTRSDLVPILSLSYNSGSGNSIFSLGWNCD